MYVSIIASGSYYIHHCLRAVIIYPIIAYCIMYRNYILLMLTRKQWLIIALSLKSYDAILLNSLRFYYQCQLLLTIISVLGVCDHSLQQYVMEYCQTSILTKISKKKLRSICVHACIIRYHFSPSVYSYYKRYIIC